MTASRLDSSDHVAHRSTGIAALGALARNASIELTPRQVAAVDNPADHLFLGTRVYVPSVPGARWLETVTACERLREYGMLPVPHLVARAVSGPEELDSRLRRLADVGVTELMLVAGDRMRPSGIYRDTLDVLESGRLVEHGMTRVGVAGHPEGHSLIDNADLDAALARKLDYAAATGTEMWVVTQFAFEAAPVIAWIEGMRGASVPLSVHVGIAGPARLKTLAGFALRCGVGASAKMLIRQPSVARLLGNWTPDAMLHALAQYRAESADPRLSGVHLFTFGGLSQTSRWLRTTAGVGAADVVDFRGVKANGER